MPRVPRLLRGPSSRPLQLTPPETFLLSQIDALLNEDDLALISGMTPAEVRAALDRLASLGAVEWIEAGAEAHPGPPPAEPRSPPPGSPRYDPAELDAPADLEPERKRLVLDLFYRLDDLTYYELLRVGPTAEKKALKSAYYAVAPEFHPDKYFRKELGAFKPKIEAIFSRITLAHDILTTPERRAEYDEYLEQTSRNRAMSRVLDAPGQDVGAILAAVEQAAARSLAEQERTRAPTPVARPAPPPAPSAPAYRPTPPLRPATGSQPSIDMSPEEVLRQRREALARKLTAGRRPSGVMAAVAAATAPKPPPGQMDPAQIERQEDAIRRRREAAIAEARRAQVASHLAAGREALERGEHAAAVNAYRIAASLEPDDPAVQATCDEALQKAAVALADGYWKQAIYEEGQDRWSDAALSYAKVCAGRPDNAQAHERVAFSTLKAGGNARRAVEFARKAVELDPKKAELHVTLARAYGAAGLEKSARGELDRAVALAPKDARVLAMVAQAKTALSQKEGK